MARPSRAAVASFATALALTLAAAVAIAVATGGEAPTRPEPGATPFVPADPAPQVTGLLPLDRRLVPVEGLVIARVKVLPTGSVPSNDFKDGLRPGEQYGRWEPQVTSAVPQGPLAIPASPEWLVERTGAELGVDAAGNARVLEKGAIVRYRGAKHDWLLGSGPIRAGGAIPEVLSERDSANFTFSVGGITVVVVDASPSLAIDRVWLVTLVIGERWVYLMIPVVPFEQAAIFITALVEANR